MSQPADAGGTAHDASIHVQENDPQQQRQQSPEDAYAEAVNRDPKNAPGPQTVSDPQTASQQQTAAGPQTAEENWSELAPGDDSNAAQVAEEFGGDQVVQQGGTPVEPAEVVAQREDADDYPADDL